jgi:type I restriction enzyme S subunit
MPEKKKSVAPRLRFPEFRDAGPWEVKRLGEIGTIIKGKGISKSDISEQGSLPCIRYGELYTHYSEVVRSVGSFTNVDAADLVLSEENDVIIPASGETMEDIATASCVTTKGVALGGDLNIFRSPVNGVFLAYYIRGTLKPAIAKIAQGISVVHLYPAQLAQLQLGVPHSEEQQKIADCLSSLDEVIELEAKRLDALNAHKKGLMQQLFPREGETTPRLRFPEFRDAGPWEVRTVEEIAEKIAQGGTPDTTVPEYWNGDIPWITPAEMGDDALCHYTEKTIRTISERGLKNSSAELLPAHSVIISSRAPIGYVTINKVPMATNQGCKAIVPKQEIYHEFLYFSLLKAKRQLNDLGAGAGFKEISASTLKNFKITLPNRFEQQKIADCLSSLDELIQLEAQKLDALKAHKKGLMQQLFPQEVE